MKDAAGGIEDAIDQAITDAGQTGSERPRRTDIDPDGLEARLRLAVPAHTFFEVEPAHVLGGSAPGDEPVMTVQATWSTPSGVWRVLGFACPGHNTASGPLFTVQIQGPGTAVKREHLTVGETIYLLRAMGALPAEEKAAPGGGLEPPTS